jgi:nucleotide-binding universal stress UspA family protein
MGLQMLAAGRRPSRGREAGTRPHTVGHAFERIMLVVADDSASAAAVRVAAELAASMDGEVLAVHVSGRDMPCCGPSAADCGLREDDDSLDRAAGQLREAGVRHRAQRWQALDDRVVGTVIAAAEEYDATLMIVGSERVPGLLGRFRRGLGLRLAARTSRPVLLVR